MSGHKIIEGLQQAVDGDFGRVTIGGQIWLRADKLAADLQEIMRINNAMRATLVQVRTVCDDNAAATCNQDMALKFVRSVVVDAIGTDA